MASVGIPDPFGPIHSPGSPLVTNGKKTWAELQRCVKNTRRLNIALSNKVLTGFTFRHVYSATGRTTRLYFLGILHTAHFRGASNTLIYVDLPFTVTRDYVPPDPEWHQLLVSLSIPSSDGQFSKEEQLLRERKRLGSFGITSYDVNSHSGKFVFPACNSLFMCTDPVYEGTFMDHSAFPVEVKTNSHGSRLDAKLCPSNSALVAFVCGNDLWVSNTTSCNEKRLTFVHKGGTKLADSHISVGVPSFVIQEEFDRYTGYWWQPKQSFAQGEDAVYRILYEEVDESDVTILNIVSPSCKGVEVEEHRYPRPGQPNAKSCLKLLQFKMDSTGNIENVEDLHLCDPLNKLFPDMEYLVRAGWTPDGKYVWAQILNRLQTKLQLVLIPLDNFVPVPLPSNGSIVVPSSPTSSDDEEMLSLNCAINSCCSIQVLYEDSSDIWVNVHDTLHFLHQTREDQLSFVWSSEKSGFRHLYVVTVNLNQAQSVIPDTDLDLSTNVNEVQVTSGDWEVLPKEVWVDENRKLVYFTGLKDTPLESHLYVVSYENPGEVVRLTETGFSHTVYMDQECSMFVTVHSNLSTPNSSHVYQIEHLDDGSVQATRLCKLTEAPQKVEGYHPPELFSYGSSISGGTMHGMVFKPHCIEEGKTYPTVLFVYGGPQVQIVSNAFKGLRYLRLHTMASLGYAVVAIDSRGSCHRGLKFEGVIKDRLGGIELDDQIEGIEWLASQVDYIDLSRVAIHGWSYGGFLSLMALVKHSDIFKVAIAGAPVTSWNLYDTGYTERYLKLPADNTEAYSNSSVLDLARYFPSEPNRLLIIHGLMDENVHFYHTSSLIDALIKAGKPYQLQVYPNERHGIRNTDCNEHYETVVLNFLQQHL